MRQILLDTELSEDYKWKQPCYTFNGSNVLIMSALKDHAVIGFFKGTLLNDPKNLLVSPGKNSQAVKQLKINRVEDARNLVNDIRDFVEQAIKLEKAGKKVVFKKSPEPLPEELEAMMNEHADLKLAFESLTPGRQRGYILYFSGAKQSETRTSRIEKCIPKILEGKGFHDR